MATGDPILKGKRADETLLAFLARPTELQENIAVGSESLVVFGTEVFDQGSCFACNYFNAPVTGKYMFSGMVALMNIDSAANFYYIAITTTNRSYTINIGCGGFAADVAYYPVPFSVLADMDAGEAAYVVVYQNIGTQQTDIDTASWFSGHLVC